MLKLIGVAGSGFSGKDSFYHTLCRISNTLQTRDSAKYTDKSIHRVALADELKLELQDFCLEKIGIDPVTATAEQKTIIRPLLVSYSTIKREMHNGTYWLNKVNDKVVNLMKTGIVCITDVRFNYYEYDELDWIKKLGGKCIFIEREDEYGKLIPPANETESTNNELVKKDCEYHMRWPTMNSIKLMERFVHANCGKLLGELFGNFDSVSHEDTFPAR